MCVSAGRAALNDTKGFVGNVEVLTGSHPHKRLVRLLAYQNRVQNLQAGPNVMLLVVPGTHKVLGPENVIDTKDSPSVLNDMHLALNPPSTSRSFGLSTRGDVGKGTVRIFDTGIYRVVATDNALLLQGALQKVSPDMRPTLPRWVPHFFKEYMDDVMDDMGCACVTLLACCFNNAHAALATPLVWAFLPEHPEVLIFPALDEHSGGPVDLHGEVETDHFLMFSVPGMRQGVPVTYSDPLSAQLAALLPKRVIGRDYTGTYPQGEFAINASDVALGRLNSIYRYNPS